MKKGICLSQTEFYTMFWWFQKLNQLLMFLIPVHVDELSFLLSSASFFNGSVHAHDIIYPRTCISDVTWHVCWYSYRQDLTYYYNNWHLTWRNVEWIIGHYSLFSRFSFSFSFFFGWGGTDFAFLFTYTSLQTKSLRVFDSLLRGVNHTHMWSVRLFIFLIFNVFIYKFKL